MEGKLNPQALEENIRHLGEKKRKFFQYPKKKWSIPVSCQPITTHGPMVLFILPGLIIQGPCYIPVAHASHSNPAVIGHFRITSLPVPIFQASGDK